MNSPPVHPAVVTETDELVEYYKMPGAFNGERLGAEYVPDASLGIIVYDEAPVVPVHNYEVLQEPHVRGTRA